MRMLLLSLLLIVAHAVFAQSDTLPLTRTKPSWPCGTAWVSRVEHSTPRVCDPHSRVSGCRIYYRKLPFTRWRIAEFKRFVRLKRYKNYNIFERFGK